MANRLAVSPRFRFVSMRSWYRPKVRQANKKGPSLPEPSHPRAGSVDDAIRGFFVELKGVTVG